MPVNCYGTMCRPLQTVCRSTSVGLNWVGKRDYCGDIWFDVFSRQHYSRSLIFTTRSSDPSCCRSRQTGCRASTSAVGEAGLPSNEQSSFTRVVELLTTLFPVWVSGFLKLLVLIHERGSKMVTSYLGHRLRTDAYWSWWFIQVILGTFVGILKPSAVRN